MTPYGNFDFWENIMKISELVKIVDATVYTPSNKDVEGEIMGAFASDMMSDVLAFAKNQDVLISGLCNPQTVRTAVMLDMKCILLVRGKIPTPDMITLARTNDIVLLSTMYKMYTTCGILYEKGLGSGEYHE